MTSVYALFHLNLAYSSLEPEQHTEVVERCYAPLLDLIEETGAPLGIELTGWTLERLAHIAPAWVERLTELLRAGRCELIGSGYAQIIGPLVPAEVNRWNLELGLDTYRRYLADRPRIALVNELAYSDGLVKLYRDAGFQGLVLDRDNALLARGTLPARVRSPGGAALPVLWADSVLFQRLQRYAHGDIGRADYLAYFHRRAARPEPLPLYCNDAEVFDFRPGRFATEGHLHPDGEWRRLARLFKHLQEDEAVRWQSPSAVLAQVPTAPAHGLGTAAHPIPVKKQAKYNLSRWAVSGRDDLWLNSLCHRLYRSIRGNPEPDLRRRLLALWASDLRTHITEARWRAARAEALALAGEVNAQNPTRVSTGEALPLPGPGARQEYGKLSVARDEEGLYLTLEHPSWRMVLNCRRGLALHRLAFATHGFTPVVGSLAQGHFDSIELGNDYYSLHSVIELPAEHRRITDLEWVHPALQRVPDGWVVSATAQTPKGPVVKRYLLSDAEDVSVETRFPGWPRPHGSVRVAAVTLLHAAFGGPLQLACRNGGEELERFTLEGPCLHTEPASTLVSCRTGFGSSDGRLVLGDAARGIELTWDPAAGAALPLLHHRPSPPDALTRIVFSLAELDETSRPEGEILPFRLTLRPA